MASNREVKQAAFDVARMIEGIAGDYATRTLRCDVVDVNNIEDGYVFAKLGSSIVKVLCDPGADLRVGQSIYASCMGPLETNCYIHDSTASIDGEYGPKPDDPSGNDDVPLDLMIYWSGTFANIPAGWKAVTYASQRFLLCCDGEGSGALYPEGDEGGDNGLALIHKHLCTAVTVTGSGVHGHTFPAGTSTVSQGQWRVVQDGWASMARHTHTYGVMVITATGTEGAHTHNLTPGTTNKGFLPGGDSYGELATGNCPLYRALPAMYKIDNLTDTVIPVGGILMWSGGVADIPAGFALCNGSGGTVDLRDYFVVLASSWAGAVGYQPGDTGGANTANYSHTHREIPVDYDRVTCAREDPPHHHTASFTLDAAGPSESVALSDISVLNDQTSIQVSHTHDPLVHEYYQGGGSWPDDYGHYHDLDITCTPATFGDVDKRPPYYALCYIQRVS